MKKTIITTIKFLSFFLGWAILSSVLPSDFSSTPAIWRLWAEIIPLLTIMIFTFAFWLIEKKTVNLHLFNDSFKGIVLGFISGTIWLAVPVLSLYILKIIRFNGINSINLFSVWVLAAFLNVIMQELLIRGYLYQVIKQKHNVCAAIFITTILFTLLHGGAFEAGIIPVLNVFTTCLLLTTVLEYTGSLIAPIVMHFLWNGIGALVLDVVSLADDYPNLLITTFTENKVLFDELCKIEGSIIVLFENVIFIILFIFLKNKRENTVTNSNLC